MDIAISQATRPNAPSDGVDWNFALNKCTAEARDADHHAGNLTNWRQEYDQISDGAFYGRIDEFAFDRLQVFREHTSHSLRQQCNVWDNSLWLGIPATDRPCRINGLPVQENEVMCRPGSCDFELVTPNDFDILGIVVDREMLNQAAKIQGRPLHESRLDQPRLRLAEGTMRGLRYVLDRLLRSDNTLVATRLSQDLVIMALLEVLQLHQPNSEQSPSYVHRKAVVDRVKSHIAEHGDAPVTMTELCELAHVSRRTLQYSFESILGISPLRFLRITRLNQVRRALRDAGGDVTVTTIATQWGFLHAGQFAHDYRQLFGECPSETLRRQY